MPVKPVNRTTSYFFRFFLKALGVAGLALTIVGVLYALNILTNSRFDQGLTGWSLKDTTWDQTLDAGGSFIHGSAKSVNPASGCLDVISQCLPDVSGGMQYDFGGQVYIPISQTSSGQGAVMAQWYSYQSCFGLLSTNSGPSVSSTLAGAWTTSSITAVTAPSGAATVLLSGINCQDNITGSFQINFDNMFLQTSPSDLSLTKTVEPAVVQPGQSISYTLAFSNTGIGTATSVVISDVMPTQLSDLSYQASVPVTATGSVSFTWQVADLAPGASGLITITGTVSANLSTLPTIITNTATITTTAFDTNGVNNSSAVQLTIKPYTLYLPLVLQD